MTPSLGLRVSFINKKPRVQFWVGSTAGSAADRRLPARGNPYTEKSRTPGAARRGIKIRAEIVLSAGKPHSHILEVQ